MVRKLEKKELERALFAQFHRRQVVTKCRRKTDAGWVILDDPFVDDWTEEEYLLLVQCLRNTLETGGVVFGDFEDGVLKGFASVEGSFSGSRGQYLELTCIHVSEEYRGRGIGRKLMVSAKQWARDAGAEKLYISAHSAVESQAFYDAMGCREAEEYNALCVEKEPCDCQLECALTDLTK